MVNEDMGGVKYSRFGVNRRVAELVRGWRYAPEKKKPGEVIASPGAEFRLLK
jgi:hypothetical protein